MRDLQERRTVLTSLRAPQLFVAATAAVVVAADQATKTWALHNLPQPRHVLGTLWFDLTLNSGAAFSLGRGITPVVVAVVVVLVAWLLLFSRRLSRSAHPVIAVALGLLLGGAVSNLADRLFRHNHGAVIDFIDAARFGSHDYWPVFNIADASIVVGVAVLVASQVKRPVHRG